MKIIGQISILILLVLGICSIDAADPMADFCNKDTNISKSSQISANIDALLAELVSKTDSTGYFATSYGKGQAQVYGLAQCRGDVVGSKDCSSCIQDAAKEIRQRCPDQAAATIWYDFCFLRYSNKSFIGEVDTSYGIIFYNVQNVTDPEKFVKELGALVDNIKAQAVVPKNLGFGKGETKLSPLTTLYAFGQCTRDLGKLDCSQCLAIAVGNYETICGNRRGCRVLYGSCYVRYELYPIFYPVGSNSSMNVVADETKMILVNP
ncbi:putative Gnk2-like domain-containing protein [Rosa chinensis]|uniref:Putative Gnk2-like domain-containing protein n=1 Tax=Rosa chinensis TaxID=74649 RepID=A0A2P6PTY7_ROSCH|nr:cysteine-rich repeat secretory protein 55 [Rosa chinensis]PRQ25391.1 putative Gnk2-like domain-containing protein [Rosa chinensis]